MGIELRLTIFEDGHQDRTYAHRITDEQLALARKVAGDLGVFKSPEIEGLNNRRGQNELIINAAKALGANVADFRDDRDGLNGERRAETIAGIS
ncbi:hypothetical protein [Parasphingopyxis sp.]|uniref:hypothetical protein n=1 Tax=Parasphingopyxis sp. TaxID=1920299 RepID=UPI002638C678|nr:hypothetical protein [Parasphingopyxis sp.]